MSKFIAHIVVAAAVIPLLLLIEKNYGCVTASAADAKGHCNPLYIHFFTAIKYLKLAHISYQIIKWNPANTICMKRAFECTQ